MTGPRALEVLKLHFRTLFRKKKTLFFAFLKYEKMNDWLFEESLASFHRTSGVEESTYIKVDSQSNVMAMGPVKHLGGVSARFDMFSFPYFRLRPRADGVDGWDQEKGEFESERLCIDTEARLLSADLDFDEDKVEVQDLGFVHTDSAGWFFLALPFALDPHERRAGVHVFDLNAKVCVRGRANFTTSTPNSYASRFASQGTVVAVCMVPCGACVACVANGTGHGWVDVGSMTSEGDLYVTCRVKDMFASVSDVSDVFFRCSICLSPDASVLGVDFGDGRKLVAAWTLGPWDTNHRSESSAFEFEAPEGLGYLLCVGERERVYVSTRGRVSSFRIHPPSNTELEELVLSRLMKLPSANPQCIQCILATALLPGFGLATLEGDGTRWNFHVLKDEVIKLRMSRLRLAWVVAVNRAVMAKKAFLVLECSRKPCRPKSRKRTKCSL